MSKAAKIDALMERASVLLEKTDYPGCEKLCRQALALARASGDYARIARIMMPLQEVSRQRRQGAAEAGVFVLSGERLDAKTILEQHAAGCLLLIDPPYTEADEQALCALARQRGGFVEVLRMDEPALRAAYLAGLDRRGDAVVAGIDASWPAEQKVERLLDQLDRIGDHERAHQCLADWAKAAARTPHGS